MVALTELKEGERGRITAIEGERRYISRLTSIGLNLGCKIRMLKNVTAMPLLVYGRDTMIALDREEAKRIRVEVEKEWERK